MNTVTKSLLFPIGFHFFSLLYDITREPSQIDIKYAAFTKLWNLDWLPQRRQCFPALTSRIKTDDEDNNPPSFEFSPESHVLKWLIQRQVWNFASMPLKWKYWLNFQINWATTIPNMFWECQSIRLFGNDVIELI